MYILILTGLFYGRRLQFLCSDTEDMHFEEVSMALEYGGNRILDTYSDETPGGIQAHVMNTVTDEMQVYHLSVSPRKMSVTPK